MRKFAWILAFTKGGFASIRESVIALLDYGSGNLRSVHKALNAAGAKVELVRNPRDFAAGYLIFVFDRPAMLPLSLVEWTTSRFPKAR